MTQKIRKRLIIRCIKLRLYQTLTKKCKIINHLHQLFVIPYAQKVQLDLDWASYTSVIVAVI